MTEDELYNERIIEMIHVYGERKVINKKFLSACEKKLESIPSSENPTKWVIGKLAFQELDDVWDNFEKLGLLMINSLQHLDQRIQALEIIAVDNGTINSKDIADVAKFAEEFRAHVEETKKKLVEYKRKMKENDLAT